MAAVTINSGPVTDGLKLREVPQEKWFDLMQVRRSFLRTHLPYDCRRLLEFVEDADNMYEALGFASPDDFIARGLELDPQDVAWAVDGLRRLKPDEPIPFQKAIALGKREIGIPGGKAGPGPGHKTVGNTNRLSAGGTTSDYILARLERDGHPELAEKVRAKAMSASAAAIAAGFRHVPTPLDRLRKAWKVATADERAAFREWIDGESPQRVLRDTS